MHTMLVNHPVRPIVSGTGGSNRENFPTGGPFYKTPGPKNEAYTRNLSHILTILETSKVPNNCILCTLDVTSLYANIPYQEGI